MQNEIQPKPIQGAVQYYQHAYQFQCMYYLQVFDELGTMQRSKLQLALLKPAVVGYLICFYSYILSCSARIIRYQCKRTHYANKTELYVFDIALDFILDIWRRFYLHLECLALFIPQFPKQSNKIVNNVVTANEFQYNGKHRFFNSRQHKGIITFYIISNLPIRSNLIYVRLW